MKRSGKTERSFMDDIYIIADACSNHNQDFDRACELVRAAKDVGCDAVKFQLFTADNLWNKDTQPSYYAAAVKNELPKEWIPDLFKLAHDVGIEFGCTAFDLETVDFLYPFVDFYKVASYEMLYTDLLNKIDSMKKPFYVSTGMSSRREVHELVYGGYRNLCGIFHCVSKYPPKTIDTINVERIQATYPHLPVGYSDHTGDISHIAYKCVNADMLEFHLDLGDLKGNESSAGHCWSKEEATRMVEVLKRERIKYTREDWGERHLRTNPDTGLRG